MARGLLTYIILNTATWLTRVVSRGSLVTADEDEKEYWTIKFAGPTPWFIRAFKTSNNELSAKEESLTHDIAQIEDDKSIDRDDTMMHDTSGTLTR
jgi:hypothetical protein